MPAAARKNDSATGHACHFPATQAVEGSPDVFIDGLPAVRQGDSYGTHGCAAHHQGPHNRSLAQGSPSVFINGKPAGRLGDAIDCGGKASAGSPSVFFDDGPG